MSEPGFVDLQVNGYRGIDFSAPDLTFEQAREACRALVAGGTALFLPTMISSPETVYERNLPLLARLVADAELGPHLPGIHLEGPFFDPAASGAHAEENLRAPDPAFLQKLQEWAGGAVRGLTLAPGLPGAEATIRAARAAGMLVALGHGVFGFAETRAAAEAGATAFTHLGNGLPHQVPRQENPILAALYEEGLDATLIGDGHHLPDPLLDLIVRVKGPERCALVSDLAPAGGLAPGRHVIFGSEVELTEAGKLFNPATGYLAGSAQTLPDAATRLLGRGWPPGRIRTLARATPLRMLGLSGADLPAGGSLRLDPDAGFVPA